MAIDLIFQAYGYAVMAPADVSFIEALQSGKLYEAYVLSNVVADLVDRGFNVTFQPAAVGAPAAFAFKGGAGIIDLNDAHFVINLPRSQTLRLLVDIEFDGLGSTRGTVADYSLRHELDIVVTEATAGYPAHHEIFLGVECKAVANFEKSIVKEVLGVRREMSLLASRRRSRLSKLSLVPPVIVPASPASEMWLAYIDDRGDDYMDSPRQFGIELRNLVP